MDDEEFTRFATTFRKQAPYCITIFGTDTEIVLKLGSIQPFFEENPNLLTRNLASRFVVRISKYMERIGSALIKIKKKSVTKP